MEISIEDHILALLEKEKKDFLSLSHIKNHIPAAVLRQFGLGRKSFSSEILNAFSGKKLHRYQRSDKFFIGQGIPAEEMILNKIRKYPGISSKKLVKNMPISEQEFITALNRLSESGAVICSLNEKHQVFFKLADKVRQNEMSDDRSAFKAVYDKIGRGRGFVRIHRIREELSWTQERFDALLRSLMADYTVELHGGDPSVMNEQQIKNSFTDERGSLYITLTWWEKQS